MKKLSLLTLFVAVVFIGLNSCSKQKKIEKNLYSKGGDWEVTYYYYMFGSINPSINTYDSKSYNNCGKMHFSKDGTGTISMKLDGDSFTESFTYHNTEDKMTITYDGFSQEYKMKWSKNTITLSYDDPSTDPDGYTEYDSETWTLSKSK